MNYASIRDCDIANGEGVRVSLFVSGCTHYCKGCFNQDQWSFDYGEEFNSGTEDTIFKYVDKDYISGLTILGGEPMEPSNQECLVPFMRRFRDRFGDTKTIWIYTGCTLEELKTEGYKWRTPLTDEMLRLTDVLVDGPFIEDLKDISLKFRGSSNQRILKLNMP